MKRCNLSAAARLREKLIKKCNSILRKYYIIPKAAVINIDGPPIGAYYTPEIRDDKKVWLALYDRFLKSIQADPQIKPSVFRDITCSYSADAVIYILQGVALLSFTIFCNLVSMYLWEKTKSPRIGKTRSKKISQLKKQKQRLKKKIKKLRANIGSKNDSQVIGNKYIQIAEIIVNSNTTNVVEKLGDLQLAELKEIVRKSKPRKKSS